MKNLAAVLVLLMAAGCGSEGGQKVPANPDNPICAHLYGGAKTAELPSGTYPEEFFAVPRDEYWRCRYSDGSMNFEFSRDGTFSGSWENYPEPFMPLLDLHLGKEITQAADFPSIKDYPLQAWTACKVGTQPPSFRGKWVWSETEGACLWFDIFPFGYQCNGITDPNAEKLSDGGQRSKAYTADGKTGPGWVPSCRIYPKGQP